ncbi:hypothetical protein [Pseudomonas amygdali]|uniref:Uncharacterized protein n=2 Tax=Pseudomonas amygdali pv. lachrymans TaxID=53707 RepID=A0ABR5KQL9_PSEAV|nr:hypothetical protein [Pseudomonas amygdali]AXH59613.1 hypothetical protein PLA107_030785 [Pseudomonas amygdali pv. lachrymans str. M301315]KPC17042.1 Uncharacterized protein AC499_0244 [Pseudomonas amygdali pv. lachrymans]KPC18001.1 Uncharacterized protein AC499_1203 [Pseudomonas amygdali pv. lachrymans]
MIKSLFTEDDLRGMAIKYSSNLLMANPPRIFEAMFEAIRTNRQKHAKIFGNYDPVLSGNPAEWEEWARSVAHSTGCSRLGYEIKSLFANIERESVDQMLREKTSTPPEGVPQGYLQRAVDAQGFNIGFYTFAASDKHYWLPPEEAIKNKPDLSLGIDDAIVQKALAQRRSQAFDELMKG